MEKSEVMRLRVQPAEKETFEHAAGLAGLPLSAWVRERLRRAARIELQDAGQRVPFVDGSAEHAR